MKDYLVLPYAPLDVKRKQQLTSEMELAAIVCLAEAKRKKKSGILGGEPEKIVSISKLYYPLWLVPWENEYITIDGMKLFSFEVTYRKLPDLASFATSIEKSKKSYEQFIKVIKQNLETFEDFASSEKTVIDGIIKDKDLRTALFEYFKKEIASKENKVNVSAFLEEKLDRKAALDKVNGIVELWKKIQLDTEALQKVISLLDGAVETVDEQLSKDIEAVKQKYASKIEEIKPIVEEKVSQLTSERDEKIKATLTIMDKELETRTKEKAKYEEKLEKMEQEKSEFEEKKELAKIKNNKAEMERWKLRIKEREKRISDLDGKIRMLEKRIEDLKKEKEKSMKQTNETYQALIKTETDKIPNLEKERDEKIAEIQEKIEQTRSQTNIIIQQIQRLMEEKRNFAADLKEIVTSWNLENIVLLYIPFYAVNYLAETQQRYEFHAPVLASSPEGLLKKIKKKLGFSLESRMGLLLTQRSKAVERMISSTLAKQIEEDYELRNQLHGKSEQCNILASPKFKEMLAKGIEKLVAEEWVKLEEKDMILKTFA